MQTNKPKLIFVDIDRDKTYFKRLLFDYVKEFSKNNDFKTLWNSYHYVGDLHYDGMYTLAIYQRNE